MGHTISVETTVLNSVIVASKTARENSYMNKHGCSSKTLFTKINSGWDLAHGLYFANSGLKSELVRRLQVN